MKTRFWLAVMLLVGMAAGCDASSAREKDRAALDEWLVNSYGDDAIRNALISQHTLYPYHFVPNDEELNALLKKGFEGAEIQRYKGLGEMNPEQLWETTMDPATRTLKQVTIKDAMAADELFTILMGTEVGPRREFTEKHAAEVKNLDI